MSHHEPFKALCPTEWKAVSTDSLPATLRDTFAHAQTIVDSIPLPPNVAKAAHSGAAQQGRARSKTEPSGGTSVALNRTLCPSTPLGCADTAKKLHKEWREVKMNPRDNPLAINVYKLGAKDGKGTWFARRSVHEGISFDKFRLGLEKEFGEALRARAAKPDAGPGAGNVRGIGAERRVEQEIVDGVGKAEVYHLSAQFPGPTTPRDFVTLLLTAASGGNETITRKEKGVPHAPRQFVVVSKPCVHPECPQRQGFIRGQYESVEIIREIPIEVPLRKVRSSVDLSREEVDEISNAEKKAAAGREALLNTAQKAGAVAGSVSAGETDDESDNRSTHSDVGTIKSANRGISVRPETDMAVEWLMVTRSDPGGSVPRFMVEKGTPAGIISDAAKLLDWLAKKTPEELERSDEEPAQQEQQQPEAEADKSTSTLNTGDSTTATASGSDKPVDNPTSNLVPTSEAQAEDEPPIQPATGLYGMITGVFGVAGSVISSRLSNPLGGSIRATDSEPDLDDQYRDDSDSESDTNSFKSFSSDSQSPRKDEGNSDGLSGSMLSMDTEDTLQKATSNYSQESQGSQTPKISSRTETQNEKELRKLHDRRRRVHEKIAKIQERSSTKRNGDKEKDEREMAKLKEKHEKELARQEEKYQRELRKIEERRQHEERKAEQRRKKQVEREEKANIALELDRVKAERDVARKQIDILKDQIGELQSQNTMLVATLGKHGLLKGGGNEAWRDLQGTSNAAAVAEA
ncbi:hypothetical protein MCOR27_010071 [Pyricularia oryzae]|uniref:DUF3074 domain-containing protein n=1 Tax=Pyricularia grisea TaxID=148305 RepID=A0ABQ8N993_PYRGI|nr:hypothetical protein MCOR01_010812 [Pyricularia oryzae]KAI6293395.1 hypothetical protein MCOR33_009183 [Pyricularia grisea]KAI6254657.1 hypothetical protein MCOR19_008843 [Pyricularia oryzae]KAI6268613.1 hypothetical protein MCOR27_010071 [Pyricularia oryzae]KAI6278821.1 hypothetical protein MCOR26_004473 [Pyricularia oryzae]